MSNRRPLIFAKNQKQRDLFLRADALDGEINQCSHPRKTELLHDLPLAMPIDEKVQEVKGGESYKAANTRKGVNSLQPISSHQV